MKELSRRLQISLLWVYLAVGTPAALALVVVSPGVMKEFLRSGEYNGMQVTDAVTVQLAIFVIVPLAMAYLTTVLPLVVARWTNVVLGLVMAVFDGMDLVDHLGGGAAFGGEVLLTMTMVVVSLLVAWLGFRLPVGVQPAVQAERELVHR